jgi:hypothetical protein
MRSTEVLGSQFSWDDLIEVSCVFIVPYNVSTMQLFELSTAGIPVVVPSKRFLAELFSLNCALGEISFYQINQIPIDSLGSDNPNNFASPEFLNFWIESADFYNRDLMQNVFYVDSFEELDNFNPPKMTESLSKQQVDRNTFYSEMRQKALLNFIEKL